MRLSDAYSVPLLHPAELGQDFRTLSDQGDPANILLVTAGIRPLPLRSAFFAALPLLTRWPRSS